MYNNITNMTRRISFEQRQKLFAFMQDHEELARSKISGPHAAQQKKLLLDELTQSLNSMGSGAKKTPEKWFKCWQDWKSDVKAKRLKIRKYNGGPGGGPSPAPLTRLEESLLSFFGEEVVEVSPSTSDPLQVPRVAVVKNTQQQNNTSQSIVKNEEEECVVMDSSPAPVDEECSTDEDYTQETIGLTSGDPMHTLLERQTVAMESVAQGMHAMASAMRDIASAMRDIAGAFKPEPQ